MLRAARLGVSRFPSARSRTVDHIVPTQRSAAAVPRRDGRRDDCRRSSATAATSASACSAPDERHAGHRPRHRPGARADAAGHDDRVRRQPHLDARRARRDRVRHRHVAGARRARVAVPGARSAEGPPHRRQRPAAPRRLREGRDPRRSSAGSACKGGVGFAYEYGGDTIDAHDDGRADDDLQHVDRRRRARRLRQPRRDDVRLPARAAVRAAGRRVRARGRAGGVRWRRIRDARVRRPRSTFDAASIEPTVTWGINPGQSVGVDEPIAGGRRRRSARVHGVHARAARVQGTQIDVAFIGSCTNGRLSDLRGGGAHRPRPPRRAAREGAGRAGIAGGAAAPPKREGWTRSSSTPASSGAAPAARCAWR